MNKLKSNIILLFIGIITLPAFGNNSYSIINELKIKKDTLIDNIDDFKFTNKILERLKKYDIHNEFKKTAELHIGNVTEYWKVINTKNGITIIKIRYLKNGIEYSECYFIENKRLIYSLNSENDNSDYKPKCEYFYINKDLEITSLEGIPECMAIDINVCNIEIMVEKYNNRMELFNKVFK